MLDQPQAFDRLIANLDVSVSLDGSGEGSWVSQRAGEAEKCGIDRPGFIAFRVGQAVAEQLPAHGYTLAYLCPQTVSLQQVIAYLWRRQGFDRSRHWKPLATLNVLIYKWNSEENAQKFAQSPELKAAMETERV